MILVQTIWVGMDNIKEDDSMGLVEASERVKMVCEEVLGRELTKDECLVLGASFELGRQYGVKQVEEDVNNRF